MRRSGSILWRRVLALQFDRPLQTRPRTHRRLAQPERRRRAEHLAQIVGELPAGRARGQVLLDLAPLDRVQRLFDVSVDGGFVRMHNVGGPQARRPNSARSFMRALNTCDFDVPSAIPSSSPTSL